MDTAIILDCEFLTAPGAPQRFWCGPFDPDPVVAQIGAVKLSLDAEAEVLSEWECVVRPLLRDGSAAKLDPLFCKLTGVTPERVAKEGISLSDALGQLDVFSDGAPIWSWGKDEFNMLAISCYVAGIPASIPATRFGNATHLLLEADVPLEDVVKLRSNTLPAFFDLPDPERGGHDALGDAQAVTSVIQHLVKGGRLDPAALRNPARPCAT